MHANVCFDAEESVCVDAIHCSPSNSLLLQETAQFPSPGLQSEGLPVEQGAVERQAERKAVPRLLFPFSLSL